MKKALFFGIIFFLCSYLLQAQDTNRIRQNLNDLSSPTMHGRGYAYNGDSIAANYIREQFKQIGVFPFSSDDYYNRYGFNIYAMEGPITFTLNDKKLIPWTDFSLAPYSKSANGTYTVLTVKPEVLLNGLNSLEQFCKKNKKVNKQYILYIDGTNNKNPELKKKIDHFCYDLNLHNGKFPFAGIMVGVNEMPVWSFNNAKKECDYILGYIKNGLNKKKESTLQLSYTNNYRYHATQNVCAVIPGTRVLDSIIIIGAHYDHLGQMGDAVLFPGCHDNASGTATVLEMARYFKEHPPKYTTMFVLFSGEEAGLMGSLAFVNAKLFDFSKVKLMLNLDLLCGGDDGFTIVNSDGDNTKDFFNTLVEKNETEHWVAKVNPRKNANNSDHAPFVMNGMPGVFLYTLGGKTGGYHKPDDTSDNASLSAWPGIFKLLIYGLENIGVR